MRVTLALNGLNNKDSFLDFPELLLLHSYLIGINNLLDGKENDSDG